MEVFDFSGLEAVSVSRAYFEHYGSGDDLCIAHRKGKDRVTVLFPADIYEYRKNALRAQANY